MSWNISETNVFCTCSCCSVRHVFSSYLRSRRRSKKPRDHLLCQFPTFFFSSYFVFLLFLLSEFNNGSTDYAEKLQKNVQLPDLDEEPCLWWSRIEKNQDSRNSHLENKGILAKLYMVTAVNHLKTTQEAVCFVCFHRCLNFLLLLFFLFFSLMHLNINCSVCEVTLILDHSELSSNTADEIRFFIFSSPFSFFDLWFHLFHLLPMHAILMPSDIL